MPYQVQLGFVFFSIIWGVVSALYLYESADIFVAMLKRPLKFIAAGIMTIAAGVLLAAFISLEAQTGHGIVYFGIPLQAIFFVLYIIGSVLIFMGARQFVRKTDQKIVSNKPAK